MRRFFCLAAIAAGAALVAAQRQPARTLDIYVVDVEGGNATLVVSPAGGSLLIDTGNGGPAAPRDAGRIVDAARAAGIAQIDHLITTHWHGDHYGGLAELASRFPIRHFIDHGPTVQKSEAAETFLQTTYQKLYAGAKHTMVRPGDTIPMASLGVRVVTANGEVIRAPLPGAGDANPLCGSSKVMNNGTRKGGWPEVMKTLYTSPGFEDLWQMHFSLLSGQEYTVPGLFIANGVDDQPAAMPIAPMPQPGPTAPLPPAHNGPAYWIKVSALEDGTFTVTNARNGFSKRYGR